MTGTTKSLHRDRPILATRSSSFGGCVSCGETTEAQVKTINVPRPVFWSDTPEGIVYWCCAGCGLPCGALTRNGG